MTLVLRSVSAHYGDTQVLWDVDLVVPDGRVVALLGPNGAGKTSLLRVSSGLLPATAGAVLLDGRDVTRLSPHELVAGGVCHVPEGRGIFPGLSVEDNLRLQSPSAQETAAIERAFSVFPRLRDRRRQLAGSLSGGEQQMLALSRTYVQTPRLVLLDEVSMGLAPVIVDEIFSFLRELATNGVTLLLVEQYVTKALELADYVYLLNHGRIRFAGEPGELEGAAIFQEYVGVPATSGSGHG
jgi:branched-chain amino acid transport system ATP-binding protein